ncbi:rod shape-determining protein RodA [Candidatus Aminicenantes bacterium AC-334-K16]|jgi:rod shape determining protein RodA|nr:rod shape-determining protein RodA [Candidatus Aminicenantes bacterium AC-334-K16]
MIDRIIWREIDWVLLVVACLLAFIGLAMIYSCTRLLPENYALRQLVWLVICLLALFLLLYIDYHFLVEYSYYFYGLLLVVLAGLVFMGERIAGTRSWIRFSFFQIQPSEIMKLALILVLARYFADYRRDKITTVDFLIVSWLAVLPIGLIAWQPDLGTALGLFPIYLGAVFLAGINRKLVVVLVLVGLAIGLLGWNFFLLDYQKERLLTVVFPERDPLGSGYQIQQSKIAIGSGGFSGKGFGQGSQSQLRFLPARHTDFIFSVLGEEFGFIGVVIVLGLYALLLLRIFQSSLKAKDRMGVYIAFLVGVVFAFQFFINILMTVGLAPVTGIPLPLISYGGSSLLTHFLALSLVINVRMRRFTYI